MNPNSIVHNLYYNNARLVGNDVNTASPSRLVTMGACSYVVGWKQVMGFVLILTDLYLMSFTYYYLYLRSFVVKFMFVSTYVASESNVLVKS